MTVTCSSQLLRTQPFAEGIRAPCWLQEASQTLGGVQGEDDAEQLSTPEFDAAVARLEAISEVKITWPAFAAAFGLDDVSAAAAADVRTAEENAEKEKAEAQKKAAEARAAAEADAKVNIVKMIVK